MEFEWDDAKAASNVRKHRLSFFDGVDVFRDPLRVTVLERIEGGERRWQTVGAIRGSLLILVVHTVEEFGEDDRVRIISVRRPDRTERRRYEEQDG